MKQIISKEEINRLLKIKGKVRGIVIKNLQGFLIKEEGQGGLKKLEDTMEKLGHPMESNIKSMGFYSLGQEALLLVIIKKLFGYNDKKFQELGAFESKRATIIETLIKYFISPRKVVKEASRFWRKYYTVGDLEVTDFNKKEKSLIVRIKNFNYIKEGCQIFVGFFPNVVRLVFGSKASCEEIKCTYKGDEAHEFLLKW